MKLNLKRKKEHGQEGPGKHRKSIPSFSKLLKVHTVRLGLLKTKMAENIP